MATATTPLRLDGGALRIDPAPGAPTGWGSASEALTQASGAINALTTHTSSEVLAGPDVSLARVTVHPGLRRGGNELAVREPSGAIATYADRLAWVVTVRVSGGVASCPSAPPGRSPAPREPGHQGYVVVVQDATHGGDAVAYTERRAGLCTPGYEGPAVDVPRRLFSVPWRLESDGRLTYAAPACGHFDSAGTATGGGYAIVVSVPLGPLCARSRTASLEAQDVGHPVAPAPTGPHG